MAPPKLPTNSFLFHVKIEPDSGFESSNPAVEAMDTAQGTAYFQAVEGIGGEQEATDYEQGGNTKFMHKLLGVNKWGPVTLRQGLNADMKLFKWMFGGGRANVTITQLATRPSEDGAFDEVAKWSLKAAIPTTWEGPGLDSGKNEIAIEKLTLAHHGITVGDPQPPPEPEPPPEPPPPAKEPIDAKVEFATNSSSVASPNAGLDKTAEELKKDPDRKVKVEGHTDNVGDAGYNQTLSEKRANAVKDYLINGGAKPEQVTATGFGETQPIADNNTAAGRAQNRRTTVKDA